jgi:hypothetical protein
MTDPWTDMPWRFFYRQTYGAPWLYCDHPTREVATRHRDMLKAGHRMVSYAIVDLSNYSTSTPRPADVVLVPRPEAAVAEGNWWTRLKAWIGV